MSLPSIDALTSGIFLQRVHRRLHEEAHEAELDAVLLLEALLVAVAQLDHRLHVHFVERRQDRRGRLRLHEALGDARAQARHRHALLGPRAQRERQRHRRRRRRGVAAAGGAGAAARAGCRARRRPAASTSPLVTRPPRPVPVDRRPGRRLARPSSCGRPAARSRSRRGRLRPAGAAARCRRGAAAAGRFGGAALAAPRRLRLGVDDRDHVVRRHRRAVGAHDLDQHAVARAPAARARPCRSRCRSGSRRA